MRSKPALLLVAMFVLSGIARAANDQEFQTCMKHGEESHEIIECLMTARDEWDRKTSKLFAEMLDKVNDAQRRKLYTQAKKQRQERVSKCGVPSPVTIVAAECQRSMAQDELVELVDADVVPPPK